MGRIEGQIIATLKQGGAGWTRRTYADRTESRSRRGAPKTGERVGGQAHKSTEDSHWDWHRHFGTRIVEVVRTDISSSNLSGSRGASECAMRLEAE